MASTNQCLASLARLSLAAPTKRPAISTIPRFLVPSVTAPSVRHATSGAMKKKAPKKKKKAFKTFRTHDLSNMQQFSLCDAMRYIRAFEVGKPPSSVKYELALKMKSSRGGPVVRNRIRFPYPVKSDTRIGVICPEDSPLMAEAQKLGAVAAGQESLFESIKAGHFPFNKLICHTDSEEALRTANVGKLLGPRGLMPNKRHGTITSDIEGTMRELVGSDEYRERDGVVRMAIGQLGFTPKMLAENLKVVVDRMKKDMKVISDEGFSKSIDEVVLGSSHSPSFSLNGKFNPTENSVQVEDLESPM